MLPLLACLVAIQVPIDQPPRLRTVFENGSAVIVEKMPGAKTLSLQLFASARGAEETPTSNGLRHLLEHIVARGPKGDLDQKLETAGGFLEAETYRDCMQFKLTLPPGELSLGLRIVEQLLQMPVVTPEEIRHESDIIAQEMALREDPEKLAAAAWLKSFGDKGLDPVGTIDVIRNATPAMLDKIHRLEFSGPNLALAVAGDVDLDDATQQCRNILSKAPKLESPKIDRGKGIGGDASCAATGQAIGLPVVGWRSPETAARVAAAFALATEADRSFMVYTPSSAAGLVIVGRSGASTGLGKVAQEANANDLFYRGRYLAKAWIQSMLTTPAGVAEIRGRLLVQEIDLRPETMIENLDAMSAKQFEAAIQSFRSPAAVTVEGR